MEERLKEFHQFINDIWQFYKQNADVKQTDEYWHRVVQEAGEIYEKYRRNESLKKIILDVIEILEEEEKKQWQKSNV